MSEPRATWSMPTTSTNRAMPVAIAVSDRYTDSGGHTPITPPVEAIRRAWSGEISRL